MHINGTEDCLSRLTVTPTPVRNFFSPAIGLIRSRRMPEDFFLFEFSTYSNGSSNNLRLFLVSVAHNLDDVAIRHIERCVRHLCQNIDFPSRLDIIINLYLLFIFYSKWSVGQIKSLLGGIQSAETFPNINNKQVNGTKTFK